MSELEEMRKIMRESLLGRDDSPQPLIEAEQRIRHMDSYFMQMAESLKNNAVCARRRVGCVLIDHSADVIGVGWNHQPASRGFCNEAYGCPGSKIVGKSAGVACEAVHAEIHALVQCEAPFNIHTCYCTSSPCNACVRALLTTGCKRIVFDYLYPNPEAREWWEGANREWVHLTGNMGIYPGGSL